MFLYLQSKTAEGELDYSVPLNCLQGFFLHKSWNTWR